MWCAKRKGQLYTVYTDTNTGLLTSLGSYEDEPPGTLAQTFNSREFSALPGHSDARIFEAPETARAKHTPSPSVKEEAQKMLRSLGTAPDKALAASPVLAVAQPQVEARSKATEHLKRLEFAYKYASAENLPTLQIKITTIQEFISEIFGEG